MKKRLLIGCLFVFMLVLLCSCECKHENCTTADCDDPSICPKCEQVLSNALGHDYTESIELDASCAQTGLKKFICGRCNHTYTESYSAPEYSAEEIYNISIASVGEIVTYDKSGKELALGTGFIYDSNGKIITNYHVIENAYSAKITFQKTEYEIEQILTYDKNVDLAVLKIDATDLQALPLCQKTHAIGKIVYAIGSSKGLTDTFTQGIITHNNRTVDGVRCVQHNADISSGNSGGPLINQYGEVIGINTWTLRESQSINFAISIEEFKNIKFGTALTFSEFYEKECDPFIKIKNYIISKGTLNSNGTIYSLTTSTEYSSDYKTKYQVILCYMVNTNKIEMVYYSADTGSNNFMVMFEIDTVDGIYSWGYTDSMGYTMSGTLYANTFNSSSLLGYSSNNISNSTTRSLVRELASLFMHALCTSLNTDLRSIGVSAKDLGFVNY